MVQNEEILIHEKTKTISPPQDKDNSETASPSYVSQDFKSQGVSPNAKYKQVKRKSSKQQIRPAYKKFRPLEDFPDLTNNKTALAKILTPPLYAKLRDRQTKFGATLDYAIQHGLDTAGSGSGVLFGDSESYKTFRPFLDAILGSSGYPRNYKQQQDLNTEKVELPNLNKKFILRSRIRVDRCIRQYAFSPIISRGNRRRVQGVLSRALSELATPGMLLNLGSIEENHRDEIRYKFDMPEPPPTCRRDYPCGRSVFLGKDDEFSEESDYSIWINEENHCSIVAVCVQLDLKNLFEFVYNSMENIEKCIKNQGFEFAHDGHFGFLTADPYRCGTGLVISFDCKLPYVMHDKRMDAILTNLRLRGEVIGDDKIRISNKDLVGVSEIQILKWVYEGARQLVHLEELLSTGETIELPPAVVVPWKESAEKLRTRISQFAAKRQLLGSPPLSIMCTGREGFNNIINGVYLKRQEFLNGYPVYEKVSIEHSVFLRWHASGFWIFDDEISDEKKGFAFCKSDSIYPHLVGGSWMVYFCKRFEEDHSVKVLNHDDKSNVLRSSHSINFESKYIDAVPHVETTHFPNLRSFSRIQAVQHVRTRSRMRMMKAAPDKVAIIGEHVHAEKVNGVYQKGDETHDDRAYWKKCDGSHECVIRWHSKGVWVISDLLSSRLRGYALVHDPRASDPTRSQRTWKVLTNREYTKNPNLKCVQVNTL